MKLDRPPVKTNVLLSSAWKHGNSKPYVLQKLKIHYLEKYFESSVSFEFGHEVSTVCAHSKIGTKFTTEQTVL